MFHHLKKSSPDSVSPKQRDAQALNAKAGLFHAHATPIRMALELSTWRAMYYGLRTVKGKAFLSMILLPPALIALHLVTTDPALRNQSSPYIYALSSLIMLVATVLLYEEGLEVFCRTQDASTHHASD